MSRPDGPLRPIGFWVKLVDRMIERRLAATLEPHGLARRHRQLLNLAERAPVTADEAAAALAPFHERGADVAEALADLAGRGALEQAADAFGLTADGRRLLERARGDVAADREITTAGLDRAEYEALLAGLERIARNLGWEDGPPGRAG